MQATIMTDPGTADRTYIGPMTPELVEEIIKKVRPILWCLRAGSTLLTLTRGHADSVGIPLQQSSVSVTSAVARLSNPMHAAHM